MTDIQSGNADDLTIEYHKEDKIVDLSRKTTEQKFSYKCVDLPASSLQSEMLAMDLAFLEVKNIRETDDY
jgi:hypothetical protein